MAPAKGQQKRNNVKSKTPDSRSLGKQNVKKTPRSAPQVKRKKLEEEIDEELSDADFDDILLGVKNSLKNESTNGKHKLDEDESAEEVDLSDDEVDDDESEEEADSDDDDESEDVEEDSDDDDDDDDDDEDEEEDSDDDDDDEEQEAEASPQEKKNLLQMFEDSDGDYDDDDDDDGDDDDESDEEDEDDDDEDSNIEEEITERILKNSSKEGKSNKRKLEEPQVGAPPAKKKLTELNPEAAKQVQQAREERDARCLFVKNLPNNIVVPKIKALSPDIVNVRFNMSQKKSLTNRGYAFLEFKSEKDATKNFAILKTKEIEGCKLIVDFVGSKSKSKGRRQEIAASDLDPLKLYVSDVAAGTKEQNLKKIFSGCHRIDLPVRKKDGQLLGFAFIHFNDEADCKKALAFANNKVVNGKNITVTYGKKAKAKDTSASKNNEAAEKQKKSKESSKKAKKEAAVKKESDDSDDDEAEDDDLEESMDEGDSDGSEDEDDDDDDDDDDMESDEDSDDGSSD